MRERSRIEAPSYPFSANTSVAKSRISENRRSKRESGSPAVVCELGIVLIGSVAALWKRSNVRSNYTAIIYHPQWRFPPGSGPRLNRQRRRCQQDVNLALTRIYLARQTAESCHIGTAGLLGSAAAGNQRIHDRAIQGFLPVGIHAGKCEQSRGDGRPTGHAGWFR